MKQRLITAGIISLIAIPAIFIGGLYFDIISIFSLMIAGYEIISVKAKNKKWPVHVIITALLFIFIILISDHILAIAMANYNEIYLTLNNVTKSLHVPNFLYIILILYLLITTVGTERFEIDDLLHVVFGVVLISLAGKATLFIRNIGFEAFLFLATVAFMADTGAYFGGRLLGKRKLNERISPKKTIEGAIIGVTSGVLFGLIINYFYPIPILSTDMIKTDEYLALWQTGLLALALSVISVLGDLSFSAIKRYYKIKDYGRILPGHGGVLDRLDGLLFVAIVFANFYYLFIQEGYLKVFL